MAEGYLLEDPELRESWETHRWGFLGRKKLTGKLFPVGFILELLLGAGLDLSGRLDALFDYWRSIDLRYFEEECALPPDADSMGLMLRLLRFSRTPEPHGRMLLPALARMKANLTGEGDVPTYFALQPAGESPRTYFRRIVGNDCGSVTAGLLLGLGGLDDASCTTIAVRLRANLLGRVAAVGGGVNVYYPAGYWLWLTLRLTDPAQMTHAAADPALLEAARGRLRETLDRMTASPVRPTPQEAAWLVLSCAAADRSGEIRGAWVRTIGEGQRHDGAWEAEPIYRVPTRHNAAGWHASRLMTTAVCYPALALCRRRERRS
jgi:hypothetical protein